jgi:hypothetical protein
MKISDVINYHSNRITTLEVKFENIQKTVDSINRKVTDISENHLPHLKLQISKSRWQVGVLVGILSAIGSAILTLIINHFAK